MLRCATGNPSQAGSPTHLALVLLCMHSSRQLAPRILLGINTAQTLRCWQYYYVRQAWVYRACLSITFICGMM